ncbi:MAG: HAD-IC family P-type ATPase, partial [Clostridia bacterium]|nr:HAD-IC family P-type ATPase [Clostridia bacterium]
MKQTNKIDGSKIPEKKNQKQMINTDLGSAERFKPDLSVGLSATQVLQRKGQGYINATKNKVGKTYRSIFFSNIFTFFNILTFIVAGALIWANAEVTQLLFLAIIVANITIGIVLEIKSKLAVEKLSLISAPNAVAVRDGEKVKIPINEVVLDDILYFDLGKQICADCIVEDGDIEVNESMLTGESVPVKKSKGDVLYSGSFVSSGSCYARVDKVGATNYVETLTSVAKSYRKPKSELQNSIKRIMTVATFFIIPISIFLVYRTYKSGFTMAETIMSASGAVVGMIPAGMFLLTSVALAVSVIRLSTRNILVQDLYCIEMLARVDVLCLDKTGTITDGSMQVK